MTAEGSKDFIAILGGHDCHTTAHTMAFVVYHLVFHSLSFYRFTCEQLYISLSVLPLFFFPIHACVI